MLGNKSLKKERRLGLLFEDFLTNDDGGGKSSIGGGGDCS
jgi:hypothetical protein